MRVTFKERVSGISSPAKIKNNQEKGQHWEWRVGEVKVVCLLKLTLKQSL